MGLDQYAFSRMPAKEAGIQWKGHDALHRWIIEHGGESNTPFQLRKLHINYLKKAIESPQFYVVDKILPSEETLAELKEQDKGFIEWAKKELAAGMEVWYDSWV
jgi:hypothetical protein